MKTKKFLAITSAMMILSGTFSGCNNNNDNDDDRSSKNIFGFGGYEDSSSKGIKKSSKKDTSSEKGNIPEEPEEMEMYNTAMQLYDTWIMGRLEGNQKKAESVLCTNKEILEWCDEYSPLNEYYNDYQMVQFLVTDISEDIENRFKADDDAYDDFPEITRGWQLDSQLMLYSPDGSYEWDTCSDSILEIDGKLYFCPDCGDYRKIEPERIGFSYPTLELDVESYGSSFSYDENGNIISWVTFTDGTRMSEEEYDSLYEDSIVTVYGYSVEKKPNGTFSFHPVSVNGKVIFDDGSTAVVDGARWAEEEE